MSILEICLTKYIFFAYKNIVYMIMSEKFPEVLRNLNFFAKSIWLCSGSLKDLNRMISGMPYGGVAIIYNYEICVSYARLNLFFLTYWSRLILSLLFLQLHSLSFFVTQISFLLGSLTSFSLFSFNSINPTLNNFI